jgi:hypothetical protein
MRDHSPAPKGSGLTLRDFARCVVATALLSPAFLAFAAAGSALGRRGTAAPVVVGLGVIVLVAMLLDAHHWVKRSTASPDATRITPRASPITRFQYRSRICGMGSAPTRRPSAVHT